MNEKHPDAPDREAIRQLVAEYDEIAARVAEFDAMVKELGSSYEDDGEGSIRLMVPTPIEHARQFTGGKSRVLLCPDDGGWFYEYEVRDGLVLEGPMPAGTLFNSHETERAEPSQEDVERLLADGWLARDSEQRLVVTGGPS